MLYDELSKIPPMEPPSWEDVYSVKIQEENEDVVSLSELDDIISIHPAYWLAGVEGAYPECYVRNSVLQKLKEASLLLPKGLRLMVLDGWRSQTTQRSLFNDCYRVLRKQHPELEHDVLIKIVEKYVALPSDNHARPSPHSTGGAVDLMILDEKGKQLFFGAPFDFPSEASGTRYFEELVEQEVVLDDERRRALYNRRLLYEVMTDVGFVNYHSEWWHYEYKTQRWAYILDESVASYGPKFCGVQRVDSFDPHFI